jgi:hypothetical protein
MPTMAPDPEEPPSLSSADSEHPVGAGRHVLGRLLLCPET